MQVFCDVCGALSEASKDVEGEMGGAPLRGSWRVGRGGELWTMGELSAATTAGRLASKLQASIHIPCNQEAAAVWPALAAAGGLHERKESKRTTGLALATEVSRDRRPSIADSMLPFHFHHSGECVILCGKGEGVLLSSVPCLINAAWEPPCSVRACSRKRMRVPPACSSDCTSCKCVRPRLELVAGLRLRRCECGDDEAKFDLEEVRVANTRSLAAERSVKLLAATAPMEGPSLLVLAGGEEDCLLLCDRR